MERHLETVELECGSGRGTTSVTVVESRSTMANALFSWSATHAVVECASMATYSGSRSWATVALGPKIRTPAARTSSIWSLKPSNPAVATVSASAPADRSMMLTDPWGRPRRRRSSGRAKRAVRGLADQTSIGSRGSRSSAGTPSLLGRFCETGG